MAKFYTRTLLFFALSFVLSLTSAFGKESPLTQGKAKYPTAYTVITPSRTLSNGLFIPAQLSNIPLLPESEYMPNVIHVKTKTLTSANQGLNSPSVRQILNKYSVANVVARYLPDPKSTKIQTAEQEDISRISEVYYTSETTPYELCMELMDNPEIEYAVPIFKRYLYDYTPNDPSIGNQYYLNKLQLPRAWDISKGDTNVLIGIVDSGVDWKHEDLNGNIWNNPNDKPDGQDNDGNGYIDDYHGWDLIGNITNAQLNAGQFKEDNDPTNINGYHGTHVAGCASAVADNGIGVAGPGFKCHLIAVKCTPDAGGMNIYRGYDGIKYAADCGADVINCSWGGPGGSPAEQDIINYALAKGSVICVSSGNDGVNIDDGGQFPACYSGVVCVGASTSADKVASFSNTGYEVSVYTPGQGIYATMPSNRYQNLDGTSMSSPVTSGIVGLIKSVHPNWSPKKVWHQLRTTCDNVLTTDSKKRPLYYGRTNAYKALYYNQSPTSDSLPGMELSAYTIENETAIKDFTVKKLNLTLTNFLGTATSIQVKITPFGNFTAVTNGVFNLTRLPGDSSKDFTCNIQLLNNAPWYTGTVQLLATITANNYTNYQLIKLPVQISSKNQYNRLVAFGEGQYPLWQAAHAPSETVFWAVGYSGLFGNSGGYFTLVNTSYKYNTVSTNPATSVYATDNNIAYIGCNSLSGGNAAIYKTTNQGTNWTNTSVSSLVGFINTIRFIDSTNGIFLGDPLNNKWAIGKTIDAGKTWKAFGVIDDPVAGESGYVGSYADFSTHMWFGTNKGKIYHSPNYGSTWSNSSITNAVNVNLIAFKDASRGIAVYTESTASDADAWMATTNDGGATWKARVYDFTDSGYVPVYIFNNTDDKNLYVLCSKGQVLSSDNLGSTWSSVLTYNDGIMMRGSGALMSPRKIRLWEAGRMLGRLDFEYTPSKLIKDLQLTSANIINYDTVDIGKYKNNNITLVNNGNTDVTVSKWDFVIPPGYDSTEFNFFGTPPATVQPGTTKKVSVRFTPSVEGSRSVMLNINSDADGGSIAIRFRGYARKVVGVETQNAETIPTLSVTPNPCGAEIKCIIDLPYEDNNAELNLCDLPGRKVADLLKGGADQGISLINNATDNLPNGVYYLRLKACGKVITQKIVIAK